jgi:hypothetical protein
LSGERTAEKKTQDVFFLIEFLVLQNTKDTLDMLIGNLLFVFRVDPVPSKNVIHRPSNTF